MTYYPPSRSYPPRSWRVFGVRDGRIIEAALRYGRAPCCPGCGAILEARRESRLTRGLPLGARAFDLDCRDCRRFWGVVQHTERSLRLVRMRRFVAALRAAEDGSPAAAMAGRAALI